MFGWKGDALQRAMDDNGCFSATCGKQQSQDVTVANKCKISKTVVEDVDGCTYCSLASSCQKSVFTIDSQRANFENRVDAVTGKPNVLNWQ